MTGTVYDIPPQPPDPTRTRYREAGALTIGIEYREVDPESLRETYKDDPARLADLEAQSPEGGFTDEGVSIHICAADDGHEYLRFDVFVDEPHYHYIHKPTPDGSIVNHVVDYDPVANGDMIDWVDRVVTGRLTTMLAEAGAPEPLMNAVDPTTVTPVWAEVMAEARSQLEPATD